MRLANRIQKLERTKRLRHHLSPIEQWERALDEAAFRVAGCGWRVAQMDQSAVTRVRDDLRESFYPKLNDADLADLNEELARRVFGDDIEAREAVNRQILAGLDCEQRAQSTWGLAR